MFYGGHFLTVKLRNSYHLVDTQLNCVMNSFRMAAKSIIRRSRGIQFISHLPIQALPINPLFFLQCCMHQSARVSQGFNSTIKYNKNTDLETATLFSKVPFSTRPICK